MTQLEILELALTGAKKNLRDAADSFRTFGDNERYGAVKSIKSALSAYDEIKELIEKEKSPDCSRQPEPRIIVYVDDELITEATPDSAEKRRHSAAVGSIVLRITSFILSVAAILISILKE